MTLPEYLYRMKAHSLASLDKERDMHQQAWLNVIAGSTEQKGDKTVAKYKTFNDFFDFKKHEESILGEEDKPNLSHHQKRMTQIAARLNK